MTQSDIELELLNRQRQIILLKEVLTLNSQTGALLPTHMKKLKFAIQHAELALTRLQFKEVV